MSKIKTAKSLFSTFSVGKTNLTGNIEPQVNQVATTPKWLYHTTTNGNVWTEQDTPYAHDGTDTALVCLIRKDSTKLRIFFRNCGLYELSTDVAYLDNVVGLHYGNNAITEIPEELITAKLTYFVMEHNTLASGQIPTNLAICENMENLTFTNCGITSIPSFLWNLANITTLLLGLNPITEISEDIGKLQKLKLFYVYNTNITKLPNAIKTIDSMVFIYAYNNSFMIEIDPEFATLPNLERLFTYNSAISQASTDALIDAVYDNKDTMAPTKTKIFQIRSQKNNILATGTIGELVEPPTNQQHKISIMERDNSFNFIQTN